MRLLLLIAGTRCVLRSRSRAAVDGPWRGIFVSSPSLALTLPFRFTLSSPLTLRSASGASILSLEPSMDAKIMTSFWHRCPGGAWKVAAISLGSAAM